MQKTQTMSDYGKSGLFRAGKSGCIMKKRIIVAVLALCVFVCLLTPSVSAENVPAIQFGTDGLGAGDTLYFGA